MIWPAWTPARKHPQTKPSLVNELYCDSMISPSPGKAWGCSSQSVPSYSPPTMPAGAGTTSPASFYTRTASPRSEEEPMQLGLAQRSEHAGSGCIPSHGHQVSRDFLNRFVFVYLDDILIFSKSKAEHVFHVRQVL
ncbi:unnamed protein product [Pleuronectes platessa]|uniref:Reverse transcriptase n=1 Tax=Pleuronectes platessa TaxID=8262 RepID=A0A9N7YQC8_PLEPL|nr:unnamed protein product [Pleuronectes platessa]